MGPLGSAVALAAIAWPVPSKLRILASGATMDTETSMASDAAAATTPPGRGRGSTGAGARRPLPWKARLGLVGFGIVVSLLMAEIILRVAGSMVPGDFQTASFLEAHPEFGRRNRPGAGWKKTSEFTSWIDINSKGLRGAEVEYAKPADEVRILVLGDSFTFAEQVNQEETFSQRLEDRLNADQDGKHYRVLNGGSNGWATANELIFLAKEGVRFQPDVVIVAFYVGNDVSDNFERVASLKDAEAADLELRGVDSFDGPRRFLRHSELYTAIESGVLVKLPWWPQSVNSDASVRKSPKTLDDANEAWAITDSLLDRTRDVTESQGAKFLLMAIPSADVVAQRANSKQSSDDGDELDGTDDDGKPGFEDMQGSLTEIARRDNLTELDLLSALRKADSHTKDRLYYRQNAHWTAAGHAVAADELYDFLRADWLKTPS
jgi:hypothetical protein